MRDFQLSVSTYLIRANRNQNIIITFRVDSIAQEPDETAQLRLAIPGDGIPRGFLSRDTLELVVMDSDCKDYLVNLCP